MNWSREKMLAAGVTNIIMNYGPPNRIHSTLKLDSGKELSHEAERELALDWVSDTLDAIFEERRMTKLKRILS